MKHPFLPVMRQFGAVRTGAYGVAIVLLLIPLLSGCGPTPVAPSPTPNPHPHKFTKLKITVEPGSGVTGVKVESLWVVGDDSCAPHQPWPSPAPITKQVNTPEKVEKIDADDYVATIVDDRFLPDKCQWNSGVYDIRFMHNQTLLSDGGADLKDLKASNVLKLTCIATRRLSFPPVCLMRKNEAFLRSHYPVFNATVEVLL